MFLGFYQEWLPCHGFTPIQTIKGDLGASFADAISEIVRILSATLTEDPKPLLIVSHDVAEATLGNTVFKIDDGDAIIFLQAIVSAKGIPVSAKSIAISKTKRAVKKLPSQLQSIIISTPGKGSYVDPNSVRFEWLLGSGGGLILI